MAACGGVTSEPEISNLSQDGEIEISNENASNASDTGDREISMPVETQIMLGTVMLEETEFAVNAEQASALLPLWKALRSLGENDTTAQAELDAVISQIEDIMTLEQVSAIEGMGLSMQDLSVVAEILGVEMDGLGGGGFGDITPEMQATREAMRESGQAPGGGPGGGLGLGGGQGPGGAELDPAARETAIAERGVVRGARSGINSFLLDGIIEFIEAKIK